MVYKKSGRPKVFSANLGKMPGDDPDPECDCGNASGGAPPPAHGDGTIDPDEQCDDGNTEPGDGCDADGNIEPGYSCTGEPSECAPVSCTHTYTGDSPFFTNRIEIMASLSQ
jgi:cysteine-rich repeat protein